MATSMVAATPRIANSFKRPNPFIYETPSPALRYGPNRFMSPAKKIMAKYLENSGFSTSFDSMGTRPDEGQLLIENDQVDVGSIYLFILNLLFNRDPRAMETMNRVK